LEALESLTVNITCKHKNKHGYRLIERLQRKCTHTIKD